MKVSYATSWKCTVQDRKGGFCDADSMDDVPWPVCGRHAVQLFARMKETYDAAIASGAVPVDEPMVKAPAARRSK